MTPVDPDNLGADLSAYLDGALDPQRTRAIERLLRESPAAREMLAELREVSRQLDELPRLRSPEDLAGAFRGSPRRDATASLRRARLIRMVTRISASAALILVGLVAGRTLYQPATEPQSATNVRRLAPAQRDAAGAGVPARPAPARIAAPARVRGASPERPASEPEVEAGPVVARSPVPDRIAASGEHPEPLAAGSVRAKAFDDADQIQPPASTTARSRATVMASPTEGPGDIRASSEQDAAETPIVQIVVTPADMQTYAAVLDDVATWDASSVAAWRQGSDGEPAARELTVHVSPARVGAMLASLNEHAPQQVRATMHLGPDSLATASSVMLATPPGIEPPPPVGGTTKRSLRRKPSLAGGEPAAVAAEPRVSDKNRNGEARSSVGRRRSAAAGGEGSVHRRVAKQPPPPTPGDRFSRLLRGWNGLYESLFGVVFRGQQPAPRKPTTSAAAPPVLAPIPVRITILAPPPAAHPPTRPASQPRP